MTPPSGEQILRALLSVPAEQTQAFEADEAVQGYLRGAVADEARGLGLSTRSDAIGNLIVEVGAPGGTDVVVFAYAMTHPANRMTDPYEPRLVVDEAGRSRLRGRGAAEQKGALTAGLLAAAAVAEHAGRLRGRLILCVSPAGETGRHDAAQVFLDGLETAPAWCIVAIGTDCGIGIANKGRLDATVLVRGRAAHSSAPWQGRNAIEGAVEALHALASIVPAGEHPQLGRATVTPTSIRSRPEATHTVPDEVEIVVDRRLLPGDDPQAALAELRAAVTVPGWEIEVEPGPYMHPSELEPDDPFVELLRSSFAEAGRPDPPLLYSHGAIDAGYFNAHGVAAVMLGPGEQTQWHTDEESVALDDVQLCADVYAAAALRQLLPE